MTMDYNANYRPHQPDFELKPKYHNYKPTPNDPLYGVIWEIYQFDYINGDSDNHPFIGVIPDACADFMITYTNQGMSSYITGSATQYALLSKITSIGTLFGIRFCSGALGNLFKVSAKDVAGRLIDGMDAIQNRNDLIGRLELAESFEERLKIVYDYFAKRIVGNYETVPLVDYSVRYIINHFGNVNVSSLEDLTGYTSRYIRKVFDEYVGVSPKLLSEIVKFQWSYYMYSTAEDKINLAELAAICGYYDQAHMNKVYKKFTNTLLKNLPKITDL
ncbi:MAG: helix-turn-helix transcriptional regulator [Lachnospiraceae bacterium]|nr:helix-turn-helix transcriptional regulator [Lachnospiraceae bacterium]